MDYSDVVSYRKESLSTDMLVVLSYLSRHCACVEVEETLNNLLHLRNNTHNSVSRLCHNRFELLHDLYNELDL